MKSVREDRGAVTNPELDSPEEIVGSGTKQQIVSEFTCMALFRLDQVCIQFSASHGGLFYPVTIYSLNLKTSKTKSEKSNIYTVKKSV